MKKLLKKGGQALIKVMRGPCIEEVIDAYLAHFESVIKVKPSASRHESNEMYLLCSGYGQSQHEFNKKVEKKEREVQNLKTTEEVDQYENEINEESRQMAEEFLADLKKTGREVTPGMKKALMDLGLEEHEIDEPPMSKKHVLDKIKKREEYETEVNQVFRQKFGIKDNSTLEEYREDLKEKAKNLAQEIDKIDAKEQSIMQQRTFEYKDPDNAII